MASEILMEPYQAARDGSCPKKTTVSAEEGSTGFFRKREKQEPKKGKIYLARNHNRMWP